MFQHQECNWANWVCDIQSPLVFITCFNKGNCSKRANKVWIQFSNNWKHLWLLALSKKGGLLIMPTHPLLNHWRLTFPNWISKPYIESFSTTGRDCFNLFLRTELQTTYRVLYCKRLIREVRSSRYQVYFTSPGMDS